MVRTLLKNMKAETLPPQKIINAQLVDECDLGIAVFWSRLGTPTEKHPSGQCSAIPGI